MVKHYGWPLFAQRQYFEEKQREKGFYSETVAKHNDFEPYVPADDTKYIQVAFPETLIQEYISRFPSQTDAYLASNSGAWPEMARFMVEIVRELEQKTGEKTEAFYCLCDAYFIREAAKELEIDILHYEWAPFRGPTYRAAAYLDLRGNICDGELTQRYEKFRTVSDNVPIFNRREILAFFLQDKYLHYATDSDITPEYEAGLGLGYNVPWIFSHLSQMTSSELYTKAAKVFDSEKLLVRYHPGDPIHADLRTENRDTGTLIEFIRNCRRVLCISSGLAYESMLFDRPAYELGQSQYKNFANNTLVGLKDHIADDAFLSFVAFAYCIPFELLNSVRYLRWRMSRPSEEVIYNYHLNYYMACLGIPKEVLSLNSEERLTGIVDLRKENMERNCEKEIPSASELDELSLCYARMERYKQQSQIDKQRTANANALELALAEEKLALAEEKLALAEEKLALAEEKLALAEEGWTLAEERREQLDILTNSFSWRLTKPLRALKRLLRRNDPTSPEK